MCPEWAQGVAVASRSAEPLVSRPDLFYPPPNSVFISFEGIDGSGKSTQALLLATALRSRGMHVVEVREPGGTDLGEAIRTLVLDPTLRVAPRSELLLFAAARAQIVLDVIEPALREGKTVIADRYVDSSTAYQGAGREVATPDWLDSFNQFVCSDLMPDRTYLIDVSPVLAFERRAGNDSDRIEKEGQLFYQRVRQGYRQIYNRYPERLVVMDGSRSASHIHRDILEDAVRVASTQKRAPL